jgi:hypothetical protein
VTGVMMISAERHRPLVTRLQPGAAAGPGPHVMDADRAAVAAGTLYARVLIQDR